MTGADTFYAGQGLDVAGFKWGNAVFPLATATAGASLLATCDPALSKILDFLKTTITTHLGPALIGACSSGTAPITSAVAQVISIEPGEDVFAKGAGFKFPLLAGWRKSSTYTMLSTEHQKSVSKVGIAYILPPFTASQSIKLVPALNAVGNVIAWSLLHGYDPSYRNAERIVLAGGMDRCRLLSSEIKPIPLGDSSTIIFHCWVGEAEIREGNEPYDVGALPMSSIQTVITEEGQSPGNPVDFTVIETTLDPPETDYE